MGYSARILEEADFQYRERAIKRLLVAGDQIYYPFRRTILGGIVDVLRRRELFSYFLEIRFQIAPAYAAAKGGAIAEEQPSNSCITMKGTNRRQTDGSSRRKCRSVKPVLHKRISGEGAALLLWTAPAARDLHTVAGHKSRPWWWRCSRGHIEDV